MPQLQAMATGSVMMSSGNGSSDVTYQYAVSGYSSGLGETTGSGMSLEHGIYGRAAN